MTYEENEKINIKYKFDEKTGWYVGIIVELPLTVTGRSEKEIIENAKLEILSLVRSNRENIENYISTYDRTIAAYDKTVTIMELAEHIF